MSILSFYYEQETKRMRNEIKSQVREALYMGAARMHLRSRGEEEDEEIIVKMAKDLMTAKKEHRHKLPDWSADAFDPFNSTDLEEANKQLRKYMASICVIYEDLGYGAYITSE